MKNILRHLTAMAIVICFAFALPEGNSKKIKVVIDAGHGGKDYGAKHDAHLEKDIAESIAEKIKALNTNSNVDIHFTRNNDEFKDLDERVKDIDALKPDLVLSLHVNYAKSSDDISGMELFIGRDSQHKEKSQAYAKNLAAEMEGKFGAVKLKEAPFFILNKIAAPGITFEMGYLSNEKDREYLTTQQGQEEIAARIVNFLKEIE